MLRASLKHSNRTCNKQGCQTPRSYRSIPRQALRLHLSPLYSILHNRTGSQSSCTSPASLKALHISTCTPSRHSTHSTHSIISSSRFNSRLCLSTPISSSPPREITCQSYKRCLLAGRISLHPRCGPLGPRAHQTKPCWLTIWL